MIIQEKQSRLSLLGVSVATKLFASQKQFGMKPYLTVQFATVFIDKLSDSKDKVRNYNLNALIELYKASESTKIEELIIQKGFNAKSPKGKESVILH